MMGEAVDLWWLAVRAALVLLVLLVALGAVLVLFTPPPWERAWPEIADEAGGEDDDDADDDWRGFGGERRA